MYGESAIAQNVLPTAGKAPSDFAVDCVLVWMTVDSSEARQALEEVHDDTSEGVAEVGRLFEPLGNDGLRYSLRSVLQYAPFVRRIHLVTSDQQPLPVWLDKSSHRINIVRHSQIFDLPEELPTFNPLAIEANINRVPGLASHLMLLSHGMYLTSSLSKSDLFTRDGKTIQYFQETSDRYPAAIPAIRTATDVSNRVLSTYYSGSSHADVQDGLVGHVAYMPHLAVLRREDVEKAAVEFVDDILATSHHRLMHTSDVSLVHLSRAISLGEKHSALAHWNQFEFANVNTDEPLPELERTFADARATRPTLLRVESVSGAGNGVNEKLLSNLESLLPVACELEVISQ